MVLRTKPSLHMCSDEGRVKNSFVPWLQPFLMLPLPVLTFLAALAHYLNCHQIMSLTMLHLSKCNALPIVRIKMTTWRAVKRHCRHKQAIPVNTDYLSEKWGQRQWWVCGPVRKQKRKIGCGQPKCCHSACTSLKETDEPLQHGKTGKKAQMGKNGEISIVS